MKPAFDANDESAREQAISDALGCPDLETRGRQLLEISQALCREWLLNDAERVAALAITAVPEDRITFALLPLVDRWLQMGQHLQAARLLRISRLAAGEIEGFWQIAEALSKIGQRLHAVGLQNDAQTLWQEAITVAQRGER